MSVKEAKTGPKNAQLVREWARARDRVTRDELRHYPDGVSGASTVSKQRVVSLDALRGFTMFWLIGGREFSLAVVAYRYPPLFDTFETQVTHPKWHGFVAWDLVMPVFLFLVGTSIPFSLAKRCDEGLPLASTYWRGLRIVLLETDVINGDSFMKFAPLARKMHTFLKHWYRAHLLGKGA